MENIRNISTSDFLPFQQTWNNNLLIVHLLEVGYLEHENGILYNI